MNHVATLYHCLDKALLAPLLCSSKQHHTGRTSRCQYAQYPKKSARLSNLAAQFDITFNHIDTRTILQMPQSPRSSTRQLCRLTTSPATEATEAQAGQNENECRISITRKQVHTFGTTYQKKDSTSFENLPHPYAFFQTATSHSILVT